MSEESPLNYNKLMCLMNFPCTICCGMWYMNSKMKNPPDAEKLSEDEAKDYIDQVQGNDKKICCESKQFIRQGYF